MFSIFPTFLPSENVMKQTAVFHEMSLLHTHTHTYIYIYIYLKFGNQLTFVR